MSAIILKKVIIICWLLIGFITLVYVFIKDTRGIPYDKTELCSNNDFWIEALLCIVFGVLSPILICEINIGTSIKKLLYRLANIGVNNK